MEVKEQIKNIKAQFRLFMNGVASQSMHQKGLVYKLNFGIELPRIKEIAAGYEKNHQLAQELWKEDIRECKILAGLLQPVDTFCPEIADIWVESVRNIEIAEITCMNLFQHLPYAPAKSFRWIAAEQEYVQVCGFLTIARLLMKKGDMDERAAGEFLDQAICAALSGTYHVRNSAMLAMRKFINHNEENAFRLCRLVEGFAHSQLPNEVLIYNMVKEELSGS
ncbi:DNA alkylation repair protein [Bacteroides sp. OttesenSCG-928-E20]|nr:DNA alkylation repair protein [Bacteroides sp. OttesenSCG-928-N06]MDL2299214.1 DNA alkylation repair protein [Bacteroides sp. OttesenSCG-928-E20]